MPSVGGRVAEGGAFAPTAPSTGTTGVAGIAGGGGAQAIVSGGQNRGLQSVLNTLSDLNNVGSIDIPRIPQVHAQDIPRTTFEKTQMPEFLNLEQIQADRMRGLEKVEDESRAELLSNLSKMGFADSTMRDFAIADLARETEIGRGEINERIWNMALGDRAFTSRENITQAQFDQARAFQNVLNDLAAGQFNVSSGLQATQLDMEAALGAAGMAANVIIQDYQIQIAENQALQDSLQSFLETSIALG